MANNTSNPTVSDHSSLIKSKSDFIKDLEERIALGENILNASIKNKNDFQTLKRNYSSWHDYNLELLKQSFNNPHNEYHRNYKATARAIIGQLSTTMSAKEEIREFKDRVSRKIDNLKNLVQKTNLLKSTTEEIDINHSFPKNMNTSQVFIVHGQDDSTKTEVARFIEKLGFEPIILHEQANLGQTIIEKIEHHTNVGFGIVLYTPCDMGAKKGDEINLKGRARQNVVFEHGYLIGKIGRKNVSALVKGNVETPNDISGVVYIQMENEWKINLAKELKSSGFSVDMNKVI